MQLTDTIKAILLLPSWFSHFVDGFNYEPEYTLNIRKIFLLWFSGHNYKTCQQPHHMDRYNIYNEYVGYASNV